MTPLQPEGSLNVCAFAEVRHPGCPQRHYVSKTGKQKVYELRHLPVMLCQGADRVKVVADAVRCASSICKTMRRQLVCPDCAHGRLCVNVKTPFCALCLGSHAIATRGGACQVCGPQFNGFFVNDAKKAKLPLLLLVLQKVLQEAFPELAVFVDSEPNMSEVRDRWKNVDAAAGGGNRAFDVYLRVGWPDGTELSVICELVRSSGLDFLSTKQRLQWLKPIGTGKQRGVLMAVELTQQTGPGVLLTIQTWCTACINAVNGLPADRVPFLILGKIDRGTEQGEGLAAMEAACAEVTGGLPFASGNVSSFPWESNDQTLGLIVPNQLHMAQRTGMLGEGALWQQCMVSFSEAVMKRPCVQERTVKRPRRGVA